MTKLIDIFQTEACGRCGGSGEFSYNQLDGTRCYGCGGVGVVYTKAAAPFVEDYRAIVKAQTKTLVKDARIGDPIARSGEKYRELASITDTGDPCQWQNLPDGSRLVLGTFQTLTFTDGSTVRASAFEILHRRMTDAARAQLREVMRRAVDAGVATYDFEVAS